MRKLEATIWPKIRQKIQDRKSFHKLTDNQIATVAGTSRTNITMFLNGKSKLGTDALLRLSEFMDFDPRDFIDWKKIE